MKTLKFTGLLALALIFSTPVWAQEPQQLTVPLSEPGKPYAIQVAITTGSIKVVQYDGKDILINVSIPKGRNGRDDRPAPSGMRRLSGGNSMDVTANEKNNVVNVGSGSASRNVMITVQIPANASSVKLSTVNGGNIDVDDVKADMEVSNTNGGIYLNNVSGSAVANTTNGHLVASFKAVDPKAAMAFTTLNGPIDVTFPESFKANIKARSDNGNVYCDFDFEIDKNLPKVTKTSQGGMYHLSVIDWIYGKIGGGGPEILLKNMHGNITIKKTK